MSHSDGIGRKVKVSPKYDATNLDINVSLCTMCIPGHTVAIWTFTFHKKSGFVKVILKANFKPGYRPIS